MAVPKSFPPRKGVPKHSVMIVCLFEYLKKESHFELGGDAA